MNKIKTVLAVVLAAGVIVGCSAPAEREAKKPGVEETKTGGVIVRDQSGDK